ncbi:hypothetical protein PV328_010993 [Microctonus aethiopoides]|uniref:Serpin domain-containing protein n=1 Tax=Microctonus aethiopoides TaxID=144406 RepID=A0AA39KQX5_9HYME|nr:hypothetical protein PV328_010993 [Microctonus aethiopoides]
MSENQEALHSVVKNVNEFSAEYFKILSEENENKNIICSPLSASVILSMVTYGARGLTEEQLRSGLHLSDDNTTKNGFQSLIDTLNNFKEVDLRLANKIFIADGFAVKSEFKNTSETIFRSASENIDFTKPVMASKTINQWCEQQTNDRIKNIVEPDDLEGAALILINAVYFKGNWAEKFDPALTKPGPFHINDTTVKEVPMMFKSGKFNFGYIEEFNVQYVELPYKNNNSEDAVSMFIMLPNETSGLKNVETNLDKINFEKLRGPAQKIHLQLPKFKIESKFDLKGVLQKMGMKEMFESTANFKGINESTPLKVSKILQKAFIEVNEEGTEAAAVTGMQIMLMCMPLNIIINRPFICVIVANHTGTQLFNARVIDPTLN